MEITIEKFKRCDVVRAKGRIDSETAPKLAETLDALTGAGQYHIVFDMSEVEFISSAGLGALVETRKTCKKLDRGELVLAAVPEKIYETLDLTGLIPLFRIESDVLHAVGSF